jgi:hypothetical protein
MAKLLPNEAVVSYIFQDQPKLLTHLKLVVNTGSMEGAIQAKKTKAKTRIISRHKVSSPMPESTKPHNCSCNRRVHEQGVVSQVMDLSNPAPLPSFICSVKTQSTTSLLG